MILNRNPRRSKEMALKAIKPKGDPARKIKILLSGEAGVGKTWAALDFPAAYYIDVEGSAKLPHYAKKLVDSGGSYFGVDQGAGDFHAVNREIKELATTDHDFLTVVVDSFTRVYQNAASQAEEEVGNDFGKDKKEANKPARTYCNWLHKIDMNLVTICHSKKLYLNDEKEKKEKYNTTFDGYDKLDYEHDLWIEVFGGKGDKRKALVRKSRFEQFPLGTEFLWSFKEFAARFGGKVFEKGAKFVQVTAEHMVEFSVLAQKAGITEAWKKEMLKANNALSIEEVSDAKIVEYIESFKKKIS